MTRPLNLTLLGATALLGACQAQAPAAPAAVPHQVLHTGSQCSTETPSVRRVTDATALRQIVQGRALGATVAVPAVDFERSLVLQVSIGPQPNPGHGMSITGARVEGASKRLVLDSVWVLPQPGRMYPMMVTLPCVVVSVPQGDYRSVAVVDAQGRERIAATLAR
ncbi:protease complex subunit PrcB family protein [Rhizobacter sp. J219]|uniref:protease complex subunit PrcB family protein n=1 Tax=Rhizobacter sp. J219 TaxID=2898430 RepID=UPI002150EFC5|nr:protease complex subunit PrcB family protein [Rhizobacter sp. J219]MCR5883135.1 protease complex subunit PrcB family protein [Rhizobacter sp. J219]